METRQLGSRKMYNSIQTSSTHSAVAASSKVQQNARLKGSGEPARDLSRGLGKLWQTLDNQGKQKCTTMHMYHMKSTFVYY
jgi:hypothetical protein